MFSRGIIVEHWKWVKNKIRKFYLGHKKYKKCFLLFIYQTHTLVLGGCFFFVPEVLNSSWPDQINLTCSSTCFPPSWHVFSIFDKQWTILTWNSPRKIIQQLRLSNIKWKKMGSIIWLWSNWAGGTERNQWYEMG